MIYGTKQLKNGTRRGYLLFDSGKKVVLSPAELVDLDAKIRMWEWTAIEKEHYKNNK